ncbi:hypothetical protein WH87_07225 [Devosia epidermidihirudinis]|uniref:Outer membrane protein beta-barrel domain-containing protein n=1 Tax=Devosia epidermidihirudinis TaxID=1293439 RepID=A0A0F5QCJ3_9HYPH|nr:outer membrane beta-barrel protein [Devosia epidermidihirudinis]KKC38712.1 hypothetical protein WH87_07225 [Devosia epidermidihirudinis]
MGVFMQVGLAAIVGVALIPACAAADTISISTSAPGEMPVHEAAFDWSGFYAGVYGAARTNAPSEAQLGGGVQLGVNTQFEFYLLGAEVAVSGLAGGDLGSAAYGQILGRAGLVVADDLVVYAAGGYGISLDDTTKSNVLVGGGLEMALTDNVSVEARYLQSVPAEGNDSNSQFTIGANFHF